ncbi:MAG: heme ABC transporter ATP-binding protein [Spirochaetaceae bacterium]|nr:heme ABC transporter ATP-binding protein [Spirochaetaceae bacterium]|tara:strand:- start:39412 stop:41292 length:1881 start_codon:yes stop_codon:yes gene_type:complete
MGLILDNVSYRVDSRCILKNASMEVHPGELHVLLGPNGAGKSTLLGLLTGDLHPSSGSVLMDQRPLKDYRSRELARRRAVLLQSSVVPFAYRAREIVLLGRLPHPDSGLDDWAVTRSLKRTESITFSEQSYLTLSGGEKQRIQLSRVLCQLEGENGSSYMLLDEPVTGLDIKHQLQMLEIARSKADEGTGVFLILHDPGLAARYADRISLLKEGTLQASGPPHMVLTRERLSELYDVRIHVFQNENGIQAIVPAGPSESNPGNRAESSKEIDSREKIRKETEMNELKKKWDALKEENPRIRIRDAAKKLSVSEMELLATRTEDVTYLRPEFTAIMAEMGSLGKVMALTRNEACVHERKGVYENISANGPMGLVVGPDIDLRIFYSGWKHAFAVNDVLRGEPRSSLQFFDAHGTALHKIYETEASKQGALAQLAETFKNEDQSLQFDVSPAPAPSPLIDQYGEVDSSALLSEWESLKDTHDFFSMLKKYNCHRLQAMELAEGKFTTLLNNQTPARMLELASEKNQEIMVFVGSPGLIQIHTGPVKSIKPLNEWINVMDPDFNLHLRTDLIHRVYLVEKPTSDGTVTSVECFDEHGEMIVQFFGKRKPGQKEQDSWTELAHSLKAVGV